MQSKLHSKHVFFPAAALFAATAPWLLVLSISNKFSLSIDPSEHSKSMLFGFIGALIAGYLLGKLEKGRLLALFVLWLGSRLLEVLGDNIVLLNLAYCAFGAPAGLSYCAQVSGSKKVAKHGNGTVNCSNRPVSLTRLATGLGGHPVKALYAKFYSTYFAVNVFYRRPIHHTPGDPGICRSLHDHTASCPAGT